jgi:hypothetical protein
MIFFDFTQRHVASQVRRLLLRTCNARGLMSLSLNTDFCRHIHHCLNTRILPGKLLRSLLNLSLRPRPGNTAERTMPAPVSLTPIIEKSTYGPDLAVEKCPRHALAESPHRIQSPAVGPDTVVR